MIRDEDLLLYHYNDGLAAAERAHIEKALASDADLAMRLRQLLADLEAVSSQTRILPSAQTRARWSAHLHAAEARERRPAPSASRLRHWGLGLAAFGTLVLGIVIGGGLRPPLPQPTASLPPPSSDVRFERGLRLHLAETQLQLVGLADADPVARAALLDDVITQNRMFALAAERANEPKLARVLRSFDAVLQSMSETSIDAQALENQSAQFGFELDVVQTKLAQASSNSTLQL